MIDECPECREMYDRHLYNETCPKCHTVDAYSGIMTRLSPELESLTSEDIQQALDEVRGR